MVRVVKAKERFNNLIGKIDEEYVVKEIYKIGFDCRGTRRRPSKMNAHSHVAENCVLL